MKAPLIVMTAIMSAQALNANPAEILEAKKFTSSEGLEIGYRIYKPEGVKLPVVLFLHGAGERGDDNTAQLKHCVTQLMRFIIEDKNPAIVIVPQCPAGTRWSFGTKENNPPPLPSVQTNTLTAVVEIMKAELAGTSFDPDRIYVSGISMGGYGTWEVAKHYPGHVAAAMPICGGGDVTAAPLLTDIPIRVFHGDKDNVVPPERSREMVEAIKAAGGTKIEYVEYPGVGHDSWTPTFNNTTNLVWMFEQVKK